MKVTDRQASQLLEEIASAMRLGVPADGALRRLESKRLGAVGRIARALAEELERGVPLSKVISSLDRTGQAAAAVATDQSGDDPALLEQIAAQFRRRCQIRSESKLAWIYPSLLLLVGYLVAVNGFAPMVRRYEGRVVSWPAWVVDFSKWSATSWWVPMVIGIPLFALLFRYLWRSGRYPRPIRLSLFCSALADQISRHIPESEAIKLAADFSGDSSLKRLKEMSLLSRAVVTAVDGEDIWEKVVVSGDTDSMAAILRYRAKLYETQARRRTYWCVRILPQVVMVLLGTCIAISFTWWILAPVYLQVAKW